MNILSIYLNIQLITLIWLSYKFTKYSILRFCLIPDCEPMRQSLQTKFAKVMFLHVSVILSTGGGLPHCMLGYHTPQEQTPLGPDPQTRHPPDQTPPGLDPPVGPGTPQNSPLRSACWEIWSTSGRYASYWNAILCYLGVLLLSRLVLPFRLNHGAIL